MDCCDDFRGGSALQKITNYAGFCGLQKLLVIILHVDKNDLDSPGPLMGWPARKPLGVEKIEHDHVALGFADLSGPDTIPSSLTHNLKIIPFAAQTTESLAKEAILHQ